MGKRGLALFIICIIIILSVRYFFYYRSKIFYKDGQQLTVSSQIDTEPVISGRIQRFSIHLASGEILYISVLKFPLYQYGQNINLTGRLQITNKGNRQLLSMSFPRIKDSAKNVDFLTRSALFVRTKAIVLCESTLPPLQSSLLLGIVFGIKKDMPQYFTDQLRIAGVTHVIVASGMNVTMTAGALYFIFGRFLRRRIALPVTLGGIIFYIMIAGIQPSIIRAGIMAAIAFMAGMGGRQRLPLYILFLTGAIMLIISPNWLFDIGFQLSFLATLGIMIVKPLLAFLEKGFFGSLIGEDLTTTMSAQLGTYPILISAFGSVNLLAFVTNILVLWTVPILMIIGGLGVIVGLFIPQAGRIIIYLTIPLLWYFEKMVATFSNVLVSVSFDTVPLAMVGGYYLILLSVILFKNSHERKGN
jgi:competence protein ComEC